MATRPCRSALAVLLGMLMVGCGGEADRATSTTDVGHDGRAARPHAVSPASRRGPRPGTGVVAADRPGPPFNPLPEDGAERLERSGYVSTTYQPAQGEHIGGVSTVLLFEADAGALDWMAYETSDEALRAQMPSSKIERFQVSDVPGANGWTGPDLHGNAIGQVYWTQGRCMLTIAIEVEGPRVEPLSAAAESIYERTGGTCPD
jgi:hypothetical protein